MAELELNKIVEMIMGNPELIEKIKAMGDASKQTDTENKEADVREAPKIEAPPISNGRSKRSELLRALQTFLSDERKKSLETMMTIADVLDTVKKDRKDI